MQTPTATVLRGGDAIVVVGGLSCESLLPALLTGGDSIAAAVVAVGDADSVRRFRCGSRVGVLGDKGQGGHHNTPHHEKETHH